MLHARARRGEGRRDRSSQLEDAFAAATAAAAAQLSGKILFHIYCGGKKNIIKK